MTPEERRQYNNARQRTWAAKNREKCAQIVRNWREKYPARNLLVAARERAKKTGIAFSIEESDVVIPVVCPVFKTPITPVPRGFKGRWPHSPSLDRIDPTRGYEKGNVWVISWRANELKRDATIEELQALVDGLREKRGY